MKKRVLVIGGSYFAGRVFMVLAARTNDYEFHVVNRGRVKLKLDGVTEHVCDRHHTADLASILPGGDWDTIVDFCAYEPNDIASLLKAVPGKVKQYIYISTCTVYDSKSPSPKTETSLVLPDTSTDPALAYAFKKLKLESEGKSACDERGTAFTVLRPGFIYGPYNYAPRESYYFKLIIEGKPIPQPTDATSAFSFVYVKDVAKILMKCIGNPDTYGEIFNLAASDRITYDYFLAILNKLHGKELPVDYMPVSQIESQRVPVPFPLYDDDSYNGQKLAKALDFQYTSLEDGMRETYTGFMKMHVKA